ncbi:CmlA/FloR family chloramphenicol efflux MFS transporter [Agrobacterium tumefaciens]|uniref:CmlA/FloR family chloramphenicol efflux MFS transporter n=1 Tax=Agrobacterium tumefaciens TaxID=358 RepID=UPI0021CEB85E|nr:CmlA/FloR family chloramphenicol efflux MFS transporter [Agrobacterium tumefaciens]UXS01253.1 CmlA/FloR family chloramphenicol efflux MFS transporter [Agrobacterium tumefaciens]
MSHPTPLWSHRLPAALLLMAPFDILASLAMDIYLPVVPAMPGILGTSPGIVQLTLSLYMVTLGAGQLVFGPVSDRIGRRPVLIFGGAVFAIASFALAASCSAVPFLLLRLLQGLGASAALVALFATVRDVYAERPEGATIYSLFGSMLAFVPALGPIAGALIADAYGWRAIFLLLGGLASLAVLNALGQWHETRPVTATPSHRSFRPMFRSLSFWSYTLGFSAAMGTFFVFFSTAPRVLIDKAGYSELHFSLMFATVAVVMILTSRFARGSVGAWGIPGSLVRGMVMLLAGAILLGLGQTFAQPSFFSFVIPMWLMATGIVFAVSVTANGALAEFEDRAGSAVALYFCIQSLFVGIVGTLMVLTFDGDTAWPLVAYATVMAVLVLFALYLLRRNRRQVP